MSICTSAALTLTESPSIDGTLLVSQSCDVGVIVHVDGSAYVGRALCVPSAMLSMLGPSGRTEAFPSIGYSRSPRRASLVFHRDLHGMVWHVGALVLARVGAVHIASY